MRLSWLALVAVVLCVGCAERPEITAAQIAKDLGDRSVGEGLSAMTFQKDAPRTVTVVEEKRSGDNAAVVIELKTESKPLPMSSFPAFSPPPPLPTVPGMPAPPTMAPIPPMTLKLPWSTPRKYAGRLRLQYEWVAGQWSLLKIENLSFKPE